MKDYYSIYQLRQKSNDMLCKNKKRIYKYEKTFDNNKECNKINKCNIYPNQNINPVPVKESDASEGGADVNAGFLLRSIVCICMAAGFIFCSYGSSGQRLEVFRTITSEIGKDLHMDDVKDMVTNAVKSMLE